MNPLKKLAGETALYGLSSIVGRTLNYLLIPFYTAYFLPAEMGVYTKMYAIVGFLNVVYSFGMETAYFRYASKSGESEPRIFNITISVILWISVLLTGLFILFSGIFGNWAGQGVKSEYVIMLALVMAVDALVAIPFAQLRLQKRAAYFATIKVFNIVLNIVLNIFFIKVCSDIYYGIYLSSLQPFINTFYNPEFGVGYIFLVNLISNLALIPFLGKSLLKFRFAYDKVLTPEIISYSFPLMLMGVTGMVNELIDRIVLEYWLPENFYPGQSGIEAIGIYGAVYKISIFMSLAIQAFRYAADPFFFSKAEDKNSPELFANVTKWFLYTCLAIFIGVSCNLGLIADIVLRNKVYHQGLYVVPVLLLANLFLGMYYNLSIWYKLSGKTYWGTIISIAGAVITLVLNFVLIPTMGYWGSALATLICYATMAIICYIVGQKYYFIPYKYLLFVLFIAISTAIVYFKTTLPEMSHFLSFSYSIAALVALGAIIFVAERFSLKKP